LQAASAAHVAALLAFSGHVERTMWESTKAAKYSLQQARKLFAHHDSFLGSESRPTADAAVSFTAS
jgi:hypothetical protein